MSPAPFVRNRNGTIDLRFSPGETDVLRPLLQDMLRLLEAEERPDAARRLFPPAYEDDPAAQEEFARLEHDDLVSSKRQAVRTADATLDRVRLRRGLLTARLDEEEQHAWLGVLNDLRLVLGTRLDVGEDLYEREPDPSDPDAEATQLYLYLGWLEEHLVEALLG